MIKYYNSIDREALDVSLELQEQIIRVKPVQNPDHFIEWQVKNLVDHLLEPGKLTLWYLSKKGESLEITNQKDIDNFFATYPFLKDAKTKYDSKKSFFQSVFGMMMLVLGIIVLLYFLVAPLVAEYIATKIPQEWEEDMGEQIYENTIAEYAIDTAKTKAMHDFVSHLDLNTNYNIQVTVVKNKEINAFALPGGRIIVFDEILKNMHDYDELAALLSHEVSHVKSRHSTKTFFRSISRYLLLYLLIQDNGGIASALAGQAHELLALSFSRELEEQADEEGLRILQANKIDPQGMIDLFHALQQGEKVQIPAFLSTHPVTENRIAHVKTWVNLNTYEVTMHEDLETAWKNLR